MKVHQSQQRESRRGLPNSAHEAAGVGGWNPHIALGDRVKLYGVFQPEAICGPVVGRWEQVLGLDRTARAKGFDPGSQGLAECRAWLWNHRHYSGAARAVRYL